MIMFPGLYWSLTPINKPSEICVAPWVGLTSINQAFCTCVEEQEEQGVIGSLS